VVSTRNCSAAAERGDGDPRSTVPAPRVTQASVFSREATIASPWAAQRVPAALGWVVARARAHWGVTFPQLWLFPAPRAGYYGTPGGANVGRGASPTGDGRARVVRRTAPPRAGGRSAAPRVRLRWCGDTARGAPHHDSGGAKDAVTPAA